MKQALVIALIVVLALALLLVMPIHAQNAMGINVTTPPPIAGNATQNVIGLKIASYVNILITQKWINRVNTTAYTLNLTQVVMPYIENASERLEECKALYDEGKYLDALLCAIKARKIAIKAWSLLMREYALTLRYTSFKNACSMSILTLEKRAKYLEQLALRYNVTGVLDEIHEIIEKLNELRVKLSNATSPEEIRGICQEVAELRRELSLLYKDVIRSTMPLHLQVAVNKVVMHLKNAFTYGRVNATYAITRIESLLKDIRELTRGINVSMHRLNKTLTHVERLIAEIVGRINETKNINVVKHVSRKLERLRHIAESIGLKDMAKNVEKFKRQLERLEKRLERALEKFEKGQKEWKPKVEKGKRRKGKAFDTTTLKVRLEKAIEEVEAFLNKTGLTGPFSKYLEEVRERFEECVSEGDYKCALAITLKLEEIANAVEKGLPGIYEMIYRGISGVPVEKCVEVCRGMGLSDCESYCNFIRAGVEVRLIKGMNMTVMTNWRDWLCENCGFKCRNALNLACVLACIHYGGDITTCVHLCKAICGLICGSICDKACGKACGGIRPLYKGGGGVSNVTVVIRPVK